MQWICFWLICCALLPLHAGAKRNGLPLHKIKLPEGFRIEIFAGDVPNARGLALGPQGIVFVGSSDHELYALVDADGNQQAERIVKIADDLLWPTGVAWDGQELYVAEISKVWRYSGLEAALKSKAERSPKEFQRTLVRDDFPKEMHHGKRFIAFGPDGKLYIPVGAPCNVCLSADKRFSAISRMNKDGSGFEVFAHGVRNTVGFDWHPTTKELWFTDNGRDLMGDTVPPDELNRAPRAGLHFGFPHCHGGDVPDPKFGKDRECKQFVAPEQKLEAHAAALGMRFYRGKRFPKEYQGQIFIAEHGSWNRSSKVGYRLTLVKLAGGKAVDYAPFAEGWLEDDGSVWGRPVDILNMPDGSLLVSDDHAGAVYRISYTGKARN